MTRIGGDSCFDGCADLPHVISSYDMDEPTDYVVWNVLPNHAEYLVALPALEDYAVETEDVEWLQLHILFTRSGAEMMESIRADIAELQADFEDEEGN